MFVRILLLLALVAYAQCQSLLACNYDEYGKTDTAHSKHVAPVKLPRGLLTVAVKLDKKDLCRLGTDHVGTRAHVCVKGVRGAPRVELLDLETALVHQNPGAKQATLDFTVYCKVPLPGQ